MLPNYLKIALRHFRKNISFGLINLFGLAFGLAAAFAVLLYVQDELSYEKFHENAEDIVRVNLEASFDGSNLNLGAAPNHAAPFLKEKLPEIKEALRVFPHNFGESASIRIADQNFVENKLYWADPNLLDVFTLEMKPGAAADPLARSHTVMLSASAAERYFGSTDPVGQTSGLQGMI